MKNVQTSSASAARIDTDHELGFPRRIQSTGGTREVVPDFEALALARSARMSAPEVVETMASDYDVAVALCADGRWRVAG